MDEAELQGKIKIIEVIHRKNSSRFDRYARIVIWATIEDGRKVWIRTVEGGLDSLEIEIKTKMLQRFFSGLVGHIVTFEKSDDGRTNFVENRSIPRNFKIPYEGIKRMMWKWVQENCAGELEKIRQQSIAKALITKRRNIRLIRQYDERYR